MILFSVINITIVVALSGTRLDPSHANLCHNHINQLSPTSLATLSETRTLFRLSGQNKFHMGATDMQR
jgi:hypothetical protein